MTQCTEQHDCYEVMCYLPVVHTPPSAEAIETMQQTDRLENPSQAGEKNPSQLIEQLAQDIDEHLPPDEVVDTR